MKDQKQHICWWTVCLKVVNPIIFLSRFPASPSVSVSCERGPDRTPTIHCASEGFYPTDLKQAWLRDGEYISYLNTSLPPTYEENLSTSLINWNFRNNIDGSYSLISYLHLSSNIAHQVMFYCWVNHSTLSKPITVNISSTECAETEEALTGRNFKFQYS